MTIGQKQLVGQGVAAAAGKQAPVRESAGPVSGARERSDRVSVVGSPVVAQVMAQAREIREARLAQVSAEVAAGSYRADPSRIAARLVDEAEITARLRSMLSRS